MKKYTNNNGTVKIKEVNGERVLTFRDIERLVSVSETCLRYRFKKSNAKQDKDYYNADPDLCRQIFGKPYKNAVLLKKSGFELLMKPKDAETVREIVNGYFLKTEELPKTVEKVAESGGMNQQQMFEALLEVTKMCLENQREFIRTHDAVVRALLGDRLPQKSEVGSDLCNDSDLCNASDLCNDSVESNASEYSNASDLRNTSDYYQWKKTIENDVKEVVNISPKYDSGKAVLHDAYNVMKNDYGVCWEQERKEYGGKVYSNLVLAYQFEKRNHVCEGLLLSIINTIYQQEKRENELAKVNRAV